VLRQVNFFGVLNGTQAFVDRMVSQVGSKNLQLVSLNPRSEPDPFRSLTTATARHLLPLPDPQDTPGIVVVTGSKQGITQPPGNPAYNASKSAVKSLAESLAHSLLGTQISAHLLVPGWTWTKLAGNATLDRAKPAAAWTGGQVAAELFARLDEFYVVCPDNDVTWELDQARMAWSAGDVVERRPALSRWHPAYKDQFEAFVKAKLEAGKQ